MTETNTPSIYRHEFTVHKSSVDRNGHVNNVHYVQWMQDVAILHSNETGGLKAAETSGATWVARSHHIDYLSPAFENDEVIALTGVIRFQATRSIRQYRFIRKTDNVLLARGETVWVFVDAQTGRPRPIPEEVVQAYPVVTDLEDFKS